MGFICAVCGEKKSGFSMPYRIFGKDGREYPACIACSKIYDALGSKDCGELERAQADLQEKLRANPQMELSLRDLLQKRLLASRERLQQIGERQKVRDNLATLQKTMPQTTGYSFEGYRIEAYCGVVCAEVVMGTGFFSEWSASVSDLFGEHSNAFESKLEEARRAAMRRLVEKTALAGGNALIGIDFDYVNFVGNLMGVIASGTAVKIEPNEVENEK